VGHLRLVDHHSRHLIVAELVQGERVADDILGQGRYPLLVSSGNTDGVIDVEAGGMVPFHQHGDKGVVYHLFLQQQFQEPGSKQFGQGLERRFRHHIKNAVASKESVGYDGVDMRMPPGIVTESLNSHHRPDDAVFKTRGSAEEDLQAVGCRFTQSREELTVVEKELAQDNGNTEDVLTVWKRIENIFPQLFTELDDLFFMTRRTEPAPPTGEGHQIFMVTVGAADAGKTLGQVTAPEVVVHHMGDYRTIKTVAL